MRNGIHGEVKPFRGVPYEGIDVVGSAPMLAVSLLLLAVAVVLLDRSQRRERVAKPPTKPRSALGSVVILLLVWLGIACLAPIARHQRRPPGRPAPRRSNPAPFVLLGMVGVPALYVGYCWLKTYWSFYDRGVARAFAEAGGDWEAAEREIRRQIDASGPSPKRTYALGAALAARGHWTEAHKCFVEIGQGTGALARKAKESQAVILNTLGRSDEAVAILADFAANSPTILNWRATIAYAWPLLGVPTKLERRWNGRNWSVGRTMPWVDPRASTSMPGSKRAASAWPG